MKFKKKIYNVIFSLMLVFVMGAFGLSCYVIASTPAAVMPDNSDSEDDNPVDNPDAPNIPDNPNNSEQQKPISPSEEDFDPNVPSVRYPFKILNYALDKMYNSAGYHATCSVNLGISADVAGSSVKLTQYLDGYVEKSGNQSVEYFVMKGEGTEGKLLGNYIRKVYIEDDKVVRFKTPKQCFDESQFYTTNYTKEEYCGKFGFSFADRPVLDFNTTKFRPSILTQVKNGKEYYIIKATGIDNSSYPDSFLRFFEGTNAVTDVKIKDVSYIFYIYKDSAQIFKMQIDGDVDGVNPQTGLDIHCKVVASEVVTVYNQKIEIESPFPKEETTEE